jgi:hypothetical protein
MRNLNFIQFGLFIILMSLIMSVGATLSQVEAYVCTNEGGHNPSCAANLDCHWHCYCNANGCWGGGWEGGGCGSCGSSTGTTTTQGNISLSVANIQPTRGDAINVDLKGTKCGFCTNNVYYNEAGGLTCSSYTCPDGTTSSSALGCLVTGCDNWDWQKRCSATTVGSFTATGGSSDSRCTAGVQSVNYEVRVPPPGAFSWTANPSSGCSGTAPYNTFSWSGSADAAYYQVTEYSRGLISGDLTTNSFTDTAVTPGTQYYYYITAYNTSGSYQIAAPAWLTTAVCDGTRPDSATINGFPAAGKTCYAQTEFPLSISVSAHDAGVGIGASGIVVHLHRSDGVLSANYTGGCSPAAQTCNTSVSIPYSALTPNQQYYLKISATDANGNGPYDNPGQTGSFYANTNCLAPFFNTSGGGDVHSNTRINTPGGP